MDEVVVIDTSAWIEFFRRSEGPLGDAVAALIRAERAALVGPVLTELLQGTRSERETRQLMELTSVVPYFETEHDDWARAGETLRSLRARGISVPLTDAVIATMAHRRGLPVLTADAHFEHLPARRLR